MRHLFLNINIFIGCRKRHLAVRLLNVGLLGTKEYQEKIKQRKISIDLCIINHPKKSNPHRCELRHKVSSCSQRIFCSYYNDAFERFAFVELGNV